jgi:hypothetical protein
MAITFEELLPFFGLNGDAVVSESAPINGPSNIVRTSESWFVKFDWTTIGPLNYIMCGNWHLKVLLEEMGVGEFDLQDKEAVVHFVSAPHTYTQTLTFPPHSVRAGLYRVTVIITMTGPGGAPGPIAGFEDLGLVQFYDSVI